VAKAKKEKKEKKSVATSSSTPARGRTSRMTKLEKKVARCEEKAPKKLPKSTVFIERKTGEVTYDGFITSIDEKNGIVNFRRKKTSASAKMLTEAFRFTDIVEVFGTPGKGAAQITLAEGWTVIRKIEKATVKYGPGYIVVTDAAACPSHIFENSNYQVRVIGDTED
jgi:hypothetical protein